MIKTLLISLSLSLACLRYVHGDDMQIPITWGNANELIFQRIPVGKVSIPLSAKPAPNNLSTIPWEFEPPSLLSSPPTMRTITIESSFYLAIREVNQSELESLLGKTQEAIFNETNLSFESKFLNSDWPAVCLTFPESQDVCENLQSSCSLYGNTLLKVDFRLPSPDEWNYARLYGQAMVNGRPCYFSRWPDNAETIARDVLEHNDNSQIRDAMRFTLGVITGRPDEFGISNMSEDELASIAVPLMASDEAMLFMLNELAKVSSMQTSQGSNTASQGSNSPASNDGINADQAKARLRYVLTQHLLAETGVTLLTERKLGEFTSHEDPGRLWDTDEKPVFSASAAGHKLGLIGLDGNVAEWLDAVQPADSEPIPQVGYPSLLTMSVNKLTVGNGCLSEPFQLEEVDQRSDVKIIVQNEYAGVRPALSVELVCDWRMQLRAANRDTPHSPDEWDAWISAAAPFHVDQHGPEELRAYGNVYTELMRFRQGETHDLAGAIEAYAELPSTIGVRPTDAHDYLAWLGSRYEASAP